MKVRPAYVSNQFYPGNPDELRRLVENYIDSAPVEIEPQQVSCMVVPHAGYIFSGPTAGYGYKRIQHATPSRVVLLGVSHQYRFEGLSLYDGDAFDSPLGKAAIDRDFYGQLKKEFSVEGERAHEYEHTLETQIPFLKCALDDVPIVPILLGMPAGKEHALLGVRLAALLAPEDIVIASTDLSHFLDDQTANNIDRNTIGKIVDGDMDAFLHYVKGERNAMCGSAAVFTALSCASARNASSLKLLDYRTSAAVSGDFHRVVGYAAISMEYDS